MDLLTFFQQIINGISLGSMYALIAIGYTMVYGVLRLINFAHADVMMVAAFAAFYASDSLGLSLAFAALFALVISIIVGIKPSPLSVKVYAKDFLLSLN
mgnify:CR=1 FL=1